MFVSDEDYEFCKNFVDKYVSQNKLTTTNRPPDDEVLRWASMQLAAIEREKEREKDINTIEQAQNLKTKE